jgi:hypothetical protein
MKLIKEINLNKTEHGKITIAILDNPYGDGSDSVASIGVKLEEQDNPDWKVHLPKANIDAVIDALQKAKKEL